MIPIDDLADVTLAIENTDEDEEKMSTMMTMMTLLQARKLSGKALSVPALSRSPSPPSLRLTIISIIAMCI